MNRTSPTVWRWCRRGALASWRGGLPLLLPALLCWVGMGCTGTDTGTDAGAAGGLNEMASGATAAPSSIIDPLERREHARTLAQRSDPDAREALRAALRDPDGDVRRLALRAADEADILVRDDHVRALLDAHPPLRRAAYRIVRRRALEGEMVPALTAALRDPDPLARARGLEMLARLDALDMDRLARLIADDAARVRRMALMELIRRDAIGRDGSSDTTPRDRVIASLADSLRHDDPVVRGLAIDALTRVGEMTLPQLEAALADADARVRENAIRALGRLPEDNELERLRWLAEGMALPTRGWRLRLDPEQRGRDEQWFAPDFDDADWQEVEIDRPWGDFGHENYIGHAWYRRAFDVPRVLDRADTLTLEFLGVDESAWVWVNGMFVGEHDMGPTGWDVPFGLEVTQHLTFGETNQLTVLVRNSAGAGGIWQPVWLRPR